MLINVFDERGTNEQALFRVISAIIHYQTCGWLVEVSHLKQESIDIYCQQETGLHLLPMLQKGK